MASTSTTLTRRSFRIISLPLTRPRSQSPTVTSALTFYHFHITSPPPQPDKSRSTSRWKPEGGIVRWASNKAADTWASFGKADESSWKFKLYEYGERLVDRLDFEELALKGIDPSLGPVPVDPSSTTPEDVKIPLVYPPSIRSGEESLSILQALLVYRTPRHKNGFYRYLFIAPLTAPFAIIPVIPNIPFFYCVWRAWSHYRAWRASQYLQTILDKSLIVPEPSQELDVIYGEYAPKPHLSSSSETKGEGDTEATPPSSQPPHAVLLTRHAVPPIVSLFSLKSPAPADIYRAVEQAKLRAASGRVDKL